MQKLKPFKRRRTRGSALVGAVALSLILAVTSVGYLQLFSSTSNNEVESLRDARAFRAAESGLFLAKRWLGQQDPFPASDIQDLFTLTVDEITVSVDILVVAADQVDILSTASTTKLPYDKQLRWRQGLTPGGFYGTFLNGIQGNNARAQGGFMNTVFDGPTHTNETILVSAAGGNVIAQFLDRTTVHHGNNASDNKNYGNGTHDNNNFDWGVEVAAHNGAWLDQNVFMDQYRHHQDKIFLPPIVGEDIMLPQSDPVATPNSEIPQKRAYLQLNGAQAMYYYWQGGRLDSQFIPSMADKIIRANNELAVSGLTAVKSTVVTNPGFNLYPVGDIKGQGFAPDAQANYDAYNHVNNYGLPLNNPNALALVSGKDIFFADQWIEPHDAARPRNITASVANQPMYITASLIAIEPGGTHRFIQDPHNGHISPNNYNQSLRNGGIRIIGSRTLDTWLQFNTGANAARDFFRVFFDRRLEQGLQLPGIPGFRRSLDNGGTGTLTRSGLWQESNVPH